MGMLEDDLTEAWIVRNFSLIEYLYRQRRFSEKTFGPGTRAQGVIDHIRKELVEIEAEPADLKEWIDVVTGLLAQKLSLEQPGPILVVKCR